jgi:hypothetical protein
MALQPSPSIISPTTTLALKAAGPKARGASFDVVFDPTAQNVQVNLNSLPPDQAFDFIGSVYIDSSFNFTPLYIQFPDSGAVFNVAPASGQWVVAVTAGKIFNLNCPVSGAAQLSHVDVVNFIVSPTGNQEVTATVVGTVTVAGEVSTIPGPVAPADKSVAAVPATTSTLLLAANLTREYVLFQMPVTTDGWISWTGAASVGGSGCFYLQAGEKYQSTGPIVTNALRIYLNVGPSLVAVIEG